MAAGTDYKLKAAYIYQFTKFTDWSNHAFKSANDPIRICVLGKNLFDKSLNSFSSRTSQKRQLKVEYLTSSKNILNCHMVFISRSEEKKLTKVLRKIKGSPVLSVSDINGFASQGGMIGFVAKKRKIGIEINMEASKLAGINISSKLLEVATIVKNKIRENAP